MRGGTSHLSPLSASLDGAGAWAGDRQSAGPLSGGEGSGSLLGVSFLGACRELSKLLRTLSDPLWGLVGRAGAGLCGAAGAQAWQGGLAEVEVAGRCCLPSASGRPEPGIQWQSGLCSLVHRGVPFSWWPAHLLWAVFLSWSLTPSRPGAQMHSQAKGVEKSAGSCSRSRGGRQRCSEPPRQCPFFRP